MSRSKLHIFTVVSGIMISAGFAGSLAGTLAWWSYSTRSSITFYGTSVDISDMLQIGLETETDMTSKGLLPTEVIEGHSYAFADPGKGLPVTAIRYYLEQTGSYAVDKLSPVTSGSYAGDNSEATLKKAVVGGTSYSGERAKKDHYVYLPLVFRVLRLDAIAGNSYAKKQDIWLSQAFVNPVDEVEDGNVYKAVRMYVDGTIKNAEDNYVPTRFIVNPSQTGNSTVSTKVGGPLNLQGGDEYYDYYYNMEDGKEYEILYGEIEESPAPVYTKQIGDSGLDPINGSDLVDESTFLAKHMDGIQRCTSFKAKTATYETLGTVTPSDDGGHLTGGKPFCTTRDDDNALARVDLTIYMEGWDHNVVDDENGHFFSLDLIFQIDSSSIV